MPSTPLVAAAVATAVLIGLLSTLLDSIRSALARRFSLADGGPDLGRGVSVGSLLLMPLAGALVDLWGVHAVLFSGSLLLAFGVAWFGVAKSMQTLRFGVVGIAFGGAGVTLAGLRVMPLAFRFGPSPTDAGAFCVGFVFVAVAALLTLYLYPSLVSRVGYRNTLLFTALACLAPAAIASFVEPNVFPQGRPEPTLAAPLGDGRFWLLALLIFFWFPIEHSLDVWPRPFLSELGYSGKSVTSLLVGFWTCFLLLRLGMAWAFQQGADIWLAFFLALIPPMVLGNLVGAYAASSGYFGFWIVGACYGPLLPAFLGFATHLFPGQTVVLGLLLSIDAFCALLIRPWFIRYLQGHTARASMRIPLVFGLLLSAAILVLALL